MIGSIDVEVENARANYQFTVKRNITVFGGDSGTGKTTLVNMIGDYQRRGKISGVTLNCSKKCVILPPDYFSWEQFFTYELVTRTQGTTWQYGKRSLNRFYLRADSVRKVKANIPPIGI